MNTKEEAFGGVLVASFLITLTLVILVIWSPASYVLGKWQNYWENKDDVHIQMTPANSEQSKMFNAYDDCAKRAPFPSTTLASSTNNDSYETYDCYYIPYKKLKKFEQIK